MTPHPVTGNRAVLGTALSVVATWANLLALAGLVAGNRWFGVACVAVLLVGVAVAVTRALVRTWWLPSVVGTVVALLGIVLRYGSPPGRAQFLPDLDAVGRAWATAQQGVAVVNDSLVPMPDVRPGEMLLVLGALTVLVLVDLAAVALGVPAVAGLALLALWIPAIVLGFPAGAWPVVWGATGYLVLLAYGAAPAHARAGVRRRAVTATAGALCLAVLGVTAGTPLTTLPGWATMSLPQLGGPPVGPLELSDDLDLRDSLGTRSSQVVMRYRVTDLEPPEELADPGTDGSGDGTADADAAQADATVDTAGSDTAGSDTAGSDTAGSDAAPAEGSDGEDAPPGGAPGPSPTATPSPTGVVVNARAVGPLRAFTLATFDGRLWQRTESEDLAEWDPALLLASDPEVRGTAPQPEDGALAQVDVQVESLRERRLPLSTFPRTLVVDGRWGYDDERDEVIGSQTTRSGLTYSMLVQIPDLTAADLRRAEVGAPPNGDLYTAVPDTGHSEDVAALAAEVTEGAEGPYRQALELQTWLRSVANFTYDTRVPPARSDDAVWDFLQDRRGYCVQFATAMAMMARTLDIPSRVGVGFLPGEAQGDGTYVVTGRLAHAWPELYFEDHGWVRFEPTPASQTGLPPRWADPFANVASGPYPEGQIPGQGSGAVPTALPSPGTAPQQSPDVVEQRSWLPTAVTVGLVLLALAAVAGVVVGRRRRRPPTSAEHAWSVLRRELIRADVRWPDSSTPRTARQTVLQTVHVRTGRSLEGAPLDALDRLAAAVEQDRYARTPSHVEPAELDTWVRTAAAGVKEALAAKEQAAEVPAGVGVD